MKLQLRERKRRCPLCREDLAASGRYGCPGCGTEFHRECVEELGGCSTLGCRLRGQAPRADGPDGQVAALLEHSAFSQLAGNAVKAEIMTPLESFFLGGCCVSGLGLGGLTLAALGEGGSSAGLAALVCLAATVAFVVLGAGTDNYYIVDFAARRLVYHRKFFGHRSLDEVASFDRIAAVAVDSEEKANKSNRWHVYILTVVLSDGRTVRIVDEDRERDEMNAAARELGALIGVPVYPGSPGAKLQVTRNADGSLRIR